MVTEKEKKKSFPLLFLPIWNHERPYTTDNDQTTHKSKTLTPNQQQPAQEINSLSTVSSPGSQPDIHKPKDLQEVGLPSPSVSPARQTSGSRDLVVLV